MKALMLAAGMGKRLGKFTNNNTKCMVEIAGKKLIDRAIEAVEMAGIKEMIIVVGYCGDNLIKYIESNYKNSNVKFKFIDNKDYAISNNIYSFYMAKDYLVEDDIILMESDLIYDTSNNLWTTRIRLLPQSLNMQAGWTELASLLTRKTISFSLSIKSIWILQVANNIIKR